MSSRDKDVKFSFGFIKSSLFCIWSLISLNFCISVSDVDFFNSSEFKFLKDYTTDVGIMYNNLDYDLSVDLYNTSGTRIYFLNEKVKHNAIGPFISLTNIVPIENSSYQFMYGAKLAALFTESKLTANQSNTSGVQTYNVTDKNNSFGGLGTISLGIINP